MLKNRLIPSLVVILALVGSSISAVADGNGYHFTKTSMAVYSSNGNAQMIKIGNTDVAAWIAASAAVVAAGAAVVMAYTAVAAQAAVAVAEVSSSSSSSGGVAVNPNSFSPSDFDR